MQTKEQPMTRKQFVEHWFDRSWKKAIGSPARYVNIRMKGCGFNVMYMPDHNDNSKWTFSVRPVGRKGGGFTGEKYDFPEHAQLAALEKAADLFGLA